MIYEHTRRHLLQLRGLLHSLTDAQFTLPLPVLEGTPISKHVRHILEFYTCLFAACESRRLNYDARLRDTELEQSLEPNLCRIDTLLDQLGNYSEDFAITLDADLSCSGEGGVVLQTNLHRELLYNIEHLVHHLALIRIGIRALPDAPEVDEDLGVAASTIRNRKLCAP